MPIADANRVALYMSEETDWAETPSSPSMTNVRYTSENFAHLKNIISGSTIRYDYQRDSVIEAAVRGDAGFSCELRYGEYDTVFENLLRNDFVDISLTGTTIGASASGGSKLTDSGAGLTEAAGFVVGAWIRIDGFTDTDNNGIRRIASRISNSEIILDNGPSDQTWATEAAGNSITITGGWLRNGTTKKSQLFEKQFQDIDKYIYYPGTVWGGLQLNVNATEIVKCNFTGKSQKSVSGSSTISGSLSSALGNRALSASANVGTVLIDGVAITDAVLIKSLSLTLDGGLDDRFKVASKYSMDYQRGMMDFRGQLQLYFVDLSIYDMMVGHTNIGLSWRFTDSSGNAIVMTLPKIYFGEGNPNATAVNSTVMLPMNFMADSTDGTASHSFQIDRLAAS